MAEVFAARRRRRHAKMATQLCQQLLLLLFAHDGEMGQQGWRIQFQERARVDFGS